MGHRFCGERVPEVPFSAKRAHSNDREQVRVGKDSGEEESDPVFVLVLLDWKDTWLAQKTFPFTPFTSEVNGLSASLDEILEEGLDNVLTRHRDVAAYCRRRIREMGLEVWPSKDRSCSPTVTSIKLPESVNDATLIQDIAKSSGILIGGGFKELKGKVLRIGHMGYRAQRSFTVATLEALESSLKKQN